MPDYKKGLIYKITTPNWLYVGSCCDFKGRERNHKSNIHNKNFKYYNIKLYQNIRENNGKWKMEKIKDFPCNNKRELEKEEDRIMLEMNADLNTYRAYKTEEEKKEQRIEYDKQYYQANHEQRIENKKQYYEKNKEHLKGKNKEYYQENKEKVIARKSEKITCDCGCKITRGAITRHRKTQKHLRLMENIKI